MFNSNINSNIRNNANNDNACDIISNGDFCNAAADDDIHGGAISDYIIMVKEE